MRNILNLLLTSKPPADKQETEIELKEFMEQYEKLVELENIFKYTDISTFDGVKSAIKRILNELKINPTDGYYEDVLLREFFYDVIKCLEEVERAELMEYIPNYNRVNLASKLTPEKSMSNLRELLESYLRLLEDRYRSLQYAERTVVKDFYYLKCEVIETFDRLWRHAYG